MSSSKRAALFDIAGNPERTMPALAPLIDRIRATHGQCVAAIVFYGSCLRSGDPYAGLVDCYVIVDRYAGAHNSRVSAVANWLLPPNVYYLECPTADGTLRAKYAVLSQPQLLRGCSSWFQSGVWGRFAQPVAIVHARDSAAFDSVRLACGQAVVSLLGRALPAVSSGLAPARAFSQALALSYKSELRVESESRGQTVVDDDASEYARRLVNALPQLPFAARVNSDGGVVIDASRARRLRTRIAWPVRRAQGRLLSVMRLIKACFTFTGAVDYAAWKLARHTGVEIEVTPRLRKHPLVFGWRVLWQLYRRRVLR